jgi:hypothetical protein
LDIVFGIFSGPLYYWLSVPFDVVEKDLFFGVVIRRKTNDQLVEKETKEIPIDSARMALLG